MANIGWGKPRIFIKKDGEETYKELPTAVEGTTSLATTKGDKQEAKIEGGENEDVRYNRNTYALSLEIRAARGRKRPIADEDGIINDNYEVILQPEDPEVDGFRIKTSRVSIEDGWSAENGGTWIYTFDALRGADGSKQLEWGKVTAVGSGESVTSVTFTETV